MTHRRITSLRILFAIAVLLTTSVNAATILPKPTRLSEHCFVWIGPYDPPSRTNQGFRMNLGFVVGKQSVVVIDSGYTPAMAKEMLKQIQHLTKKPVAYVVNTNSQPHRFFGNDVFRHSGAKIIAAADAAARMQHDGNEFSLSIAATLKIPQPQVPVPKAPDILIAAGQSHSIDLGDVQVTLREFGRTHTRGSLVVTTQPDNVVFAGDILFGGRLPALLPDGNIKYWISAYQQLHQYKDATFVPGHGQPANLAAFAHPTLDYLTYLRTTMAAAMQNKLEVNQAIAMVHDSAWKDLNNYDALSRRNAYQAYLESQEAEFD